jgi:hypothetical protein
MTNATKKLVWLIVISAILLFAGLIYVQRYSIYDWWVLRSYDAPADIQTLANNSSMSDYGARLFYINTPELLDGSQFNSSCTHTEETIVLGCYTGKDIYIYNVDKPELSGIKEVTAAHEMLHAAYQRLNPSERERVNSLLLNMYQKIQNPRIIKLVKTYEQQDPSIVPNELHSILGTEVELLDQELEDYYKKYFIDRKAVVNYSKQYEAVFDSIKNEIDRLYGELSLRKTEIQNREASLEIQKTEIDSISIQMQGYQSSGNISAYNNLVPKYNNLVNSYNTSISELRTLIDEYNELVGKYNSQTVIQKELINSIDSQYTAE